MNDNIEEKKQKKTVKQKIFKIIKIILLIILGFILFYIVFNLCCSVYENVKFNSYKYGKELDINGHKMVVSVTGENNNSTLILLTGHSSPSPVIHYKPFTEPLSEKYKVVVLEPFGYGLSDVLDPNSNERTLKNVVTELHTAVEQLGIKKYYLVGHSLGGMYALHWSNTYPDEVLGYVGLDATVDVFTHEEIKKNYDIEKKIGWLNFVGIQRMMSLFNKKNLFLPLYSNYDYSDKEVEMFRIIALKRFFNKLVTNEMYLLGDNLDQLKGVKIPETIPSINYICSDNVESIPKWKDLHIEMGHNSTTNEVVELKGGHLFFYVDNLETVKTKFDTWIV